MTHCLVVGEGERSRLIVAALQRLDVTVRTGGSGAAGDPCELVVLVAEADDATLEAACAARREGSLILLHPGPPRPLPELVWRAAEVVAVGAVEASALTEVEVADPLAAEDAALALLRRGPGLVVVDLRAEGAVVARRGRATYLPPFSVAAVDPGGAAECFVAALGVAMLERLDNFAATGYALAAAAVCLGRAGTDEAMPTRDDVDRMAHSVDLRRDPGTMPVEFPH